MPDREKVIESVERAFDIWIGEYEGTSYYDIAEVKQAKADALALLKEQEAVVRCKDCKHRPKVPDWETYEDGGDIEFPDGKCPCQCSSDRYYSWYPDDDWFCAEGERRAGNG